MKLPLVSIITIVKNGKIFLKPYLRSIQNQTYKKIEIIIQDGASSDGTPEYIQDFKKIIKVNIKLESTKDRNGAEAVNKAIKRCSGDIVGIINADDILNKNACQIAIDYFNKRPSYAALYGANKLITENGKYINTFKPMPFDLIKLLKCELVPTTNGSFYNLNICRSNFHFDEEVKTCGDFDLWLRLSQFPILNIGKVLASTRLSKQSSTRKVQNYEQFCADKITFLKNFFNKFEQNILTDVILKTSISGIYAWAAESILNLEGKSKKFHFYINKALEYDPNSERVKHLKLKAKAV